MKFFFTVVFITGLITACLGISFYYGTVKAQNENLAVYMANYFYNQGYDAAMLQKSN